MSDISSRISTVIKSSGLTKTAFSKKIGLSQPFVSQLASGDASPSDRTIVDICREFGVNERWLRTGEGEMKQKLTRNQEIAEFMGVVMHDPDDSPRKRFVSIISKLSVDEWQLLAEIAKKMAEDE